MATSLLDEIKSGYEKLQMNLPPTKAELDKLSNYLRIEFIHSQLAFNNSDCLKRSQIIKIVENQMKLNDINLIIQQEAINLNKAYNLIHLLAEQDKLITQNTLFKLISTLNEGVSKDNQSNFRQEDQTVLNSKKSFPKPDNISTLIDGYLEWLNSQENNPKETPKKTLNTYQGLIYIRPFKNNNRLLATLITSYLLLKNSYPPLLVAKDREAYDEKIQIALKQANIKPLRKLLYSSVLDSIKEANSFLARNQEQKTYPLAAPSKDLLKIGQVANRTNETVPTIRHWTQKNLLKPIGETKGGFMLYSKQALEQAKRIRELQKQRLTLEEIARVFDKES
jgi:hypothetical protein